MPSSVCLRGFRRIRHRTRTHGKFLFPSPQIDQENQIRAGERVTGSLKKGDKIVTIGGIFGEVEAVTEQYFTIKVESGATLKMVKGSVAFKQEDMQPMQDK